MRKKWPWVLAIVLLLLAGGGFLLWRSGFFAAFTSLRAMQGALPCANQIQNQREVSL